MHVGYNFHMILHGAVKEASFVKARQTKPLYLRIWDARYLYALLLPLLIFLIVFKYVPMVGLQIAFKKYSAKLGVWGSKWIGMDNFRRIFISPDAISAIRNTLVISFERLIFEFPVPIILAMLINEMPGRGVKRVYQTILTFPHFLSWVIVASILNNFLSNTGSLNTMISKLGGTTISFLSTPRIFRPILYITANWKHMGYSSIIYIAAIAGIDPTLHEAAIVDGASRLRRIWSITLPCISSTIIVLFIMQVGNIMNAGFDQTFNMMNDAVKSVADILDTYVYRITFRATPSYGFSAAVGMFKSVINFAMLIVADRVIKLLGGSGMFA